MLIAWLPQGVLAPDDSQTYSDTCTKMSSVPFSGVMNPWPWERENCLQTPLKMGPAEARAVLQEERDGDVSLAALAQGVAQEEVCYENVVLSGRAPGTHPQHSRQVAAVMLGTKMVTCTRHKWFCRCCWSLLGSAGQCQTLLPHAGYLRRVGPGPLGGEGAGQVPQQKVASLPDAAALPLEGECGPHWRLGGVEGWHRWRSTGIR